jgi:RNA polymerase sigma-70 factor, ECF subfamily
MEVQNAKQASVQPELTPEFDGDQEVLGQVFSRHKNQLYWTAFRVLGCHEDSEDAVQDGLLAAARNLSSFEGRAQFSTWLTRIVLNAALMRRRKLHGRVIASAGQQDQDESGLSLAAKLADPRPDPEEAYAREERLRMVKRWLETLPASQRAALWFRDVEGMTTQEAADALHVPEGTLKSRLHRGRVEFSKRFRENFGSQRGDHGK